MVHGHVFWHMNAHTHHTYAAKDAETDTVWMSKDGVQASHRPDVHPGFITNITFS